MIGSKKTNRHNQSKSTQVTLILPEGEKLSFENNYAIWKL
jgi:hypothetical protein